LISQTATRLALVSAKINMGASLNSSALYLQVAGKIELLIRSGTLRPGGRVPSVRRACAQHGVSLTTIVQAYLELENRGLIEARPRSGFFVRPQLRDQTLEPVTSRVKNSAAHVGVGSLQSRIFDAAGMPEVVPFGAAYPGRKIFR
jgi:DNA-binding transcriptional regulator YhcF (GntR family)